MSRLRRDEALDVLRRHKTEFAERYGVTELGVFGSVARDEATEESDVDVVVEMRKPDLYFIVHIKDALEEDFHRRVDIIEYWEKMSHFLKKRIDQEAVYV